MTEPLPEALQLFNQRLLAEGCLSADQAKELWESDLADYDKGDVQVFKKALTLSNRALAAAGLEIRGIIMEDITYYAMVNKRADEIAKLGFSAAFSIAEVNYVRLIVEKLVEGPCSKANLMNLKNSLKDGESLTMDQATAVVDRLVSDHWIWAAGSSRQAKRRTTTSTQLSLAPRAFMELSYMIVDQFEMENADLPQQIHF